MDLLELKTYSRTELEQLFNTSRTDSIKRSLERAGYTFQSSGRGRTYQIQITALPSPPSEFAAFAQKHFDCGEQTNFDVMELYFFLLFYHSEFRYFPAVYQSQYINENYSIEISDQTLRNWRRKLEEKNLISTDEEDAKFYSDAIKTHMGNWITDYNGNEVLEKPKTKYQNFVHMCDYLASRKCILVPFDSNNKISA